MTTCLAAAAALAVAPLPASAGIQVPKGFRADVLATGFVHPTAMAFGPDGRLYVTQNEGRVVALAPGARRPVRFASGFTVPLGLAWLGRTLFVSVSGGLQSVRLAGTRATPRRTVVSHLPYRLHQQDNVVVGRDGRLYLGNGSTCNACRERDPRSATVLSLRPDGSDLRVVARGLRNPYGLAVQPGTGRLFASENGRDDLGPSNPAETIVEIRPGRRFGWPRCWADARTLRLVGACRGVTQPVAFLEPHSSADGIAFYDGTAFPSPYRGDLFVAEWGEYLSKRHGRVVVRIPFDEQGRPQRRRAEIFARGFSHPLALAVDDHGALLVADWGSGTIYRIRAVPPAIPPPAPRAVRRMLGE